MQINGFANHLIKQGLLTEKRAEQSTQSAIANNASLIRYLQQNDVLNHKDIAEQSALYFGLKYADLTDYDIDTQANLLDKKLIEKYHVLPLKKNQGELELAISDPAQNSFLNEIKFHTNLSIKLYLADHDKLTNLIDNILYAHRYDAFNSEDAHIIQFIDKILTEAISKAASDIHFEPYKDSYRIRFRIDGMLHIITEPDLNLAKRITARLKIMSQLDIAERRLPQDGRFTFATHDCRINVCPTIFGEKVVVRILNATNLQLQISELGMEQLQEQQFLQTLAKPQGMILVTGPTGSGKTVSLYAALQHLNETSKNISTVEDPVEINLPGINQVNVNPKINLDFAATLRAFLRQDPDIIMLGEIRDKETAEIALKAAQTGHLVLATLHTNSAIDTITRLLNIGIAAFNISNSVTLVIAQRLIRKLCPHCKQPQKNVTSEYLLAHGFAAQEIDNLKLSQAYGCKHCNKGYKGRTAIFEALAITEDLNSLIMQHKDSQILRQKACDSGMLTLSAAALNKVRQGLTSLAEIDRCL
ncbi:MAG: Flp pilus assembly complex ATPase component TadA [Gammaproteobacteria bacterium]|nr:Flp pilus assembly complex ATPase component TadA [Gammaproteobacteria bacterium]